MKYPSAFLQSSATRRTGLQIQWTDLPALPLGLGGQAVGAIAGVLIVAGGSFWLAATGDARSKHYSDEILGLREIDGRWATIGHLPVPAAYAAFAIHGDDLYIAGGENSDGILRSVYRLSVREDRVKVVALPDLPFPLVNGCGAFLGGQFHVCCGQMGKNLNTATNRHWSLRDGKWVELASLPARPRILPICQSLEARLTVASGASSEIRSNETVRGYLVDIWIFDVETGWNEVGTLPSPSVAAPSFCNGKEVFIFGGDDGSHSAHPAFREEHPGFLKRVVTFSRDGVTRVVGQSLPLGLVTTGATLWRDTVVIAGGEDRAGSRSSRVFACQEKLLVCNES